MSLRSAYEPRPYGSSAIWSFESSDVIEICDRIHIRDLNLRTTFNSTVVLALVYQARPSLTLQKSEGERGSSLIDYVSLYVQLYQMNLDPKA